MNYTIFSPDNDGIDAIQAKQRSVKIFNLTSFTQKFKFLTWVIGNVKRLIVVIRICLYQIIIPEECKNISFQGLYLMVDPEYKVKNTRLGSGLFIFSF